MWSVLSGQQYTGQHLKLLVMKRSTITVCNNPSFLSSSGQMRRNHACPTVISRLA